MTCDQSTENSYSKTLIRLRPVMTVDPNEDWFRNLDNWKILHLESKLTETFYECKNDNSPRADRSLKLDKLGENFDIHEKAIGDGPRLRRKSEQRKKRANFIEDSGI